MGRREAYPHLRRRGRDPVQKLCERHLKGACRRADIREKRRRRRPQGETETKQLQRSALTSYARRKQRRRQAAETSRRHHNGPSSHRSVPLGFVDRRETLSVNPREGFSPLGFPRPLPGPRNPGRRRRGRRIFRPVGEGVDVLAEEGHFTDALVRQRTDLACGQAGGNRSGFGTVGDEAGKMQRTTPQVRRSTAEAAVARNEWGEGAGV